MNTLISVIIPVYNVVKYLERCVESVINQTYSDLEIILVDDGSTDGSGELCEKLAERDQRISVVHQENQGLGPARNTGLNIMHGEYVAFLDSDDWVDSHMYEKMYNAANDNGSDIVTCGKVIVSDEGIIGKVYCDGKPLIIDNKEAVKHFLLQKDMNMSACDKLFRSTLFDDVRFPGRHLISEDIIPIYTVINNSTKVVITKEPLYNYYYRLGSLSKSSFSPRTMGAYLYAKQLKDLVLKDFPDLAEEVSYFVFDELIGTYRTARRSGYRGKENDELLCDIKRDYKAIQKNKFLYKRQKIYAFLALIKCDRLMDKLYITAKQLVQKVKALRS